MSHSTTAARNSGASASSARCSIASSGRWKRSAEKLHFAPPEQQGRRAARHEDRGRSTRAAYEEIRRYVISYFFISVIVFISKGALWR